MAMPLSPPNAFNDRDRGLVEERNAVPQQIAFVGGEQQRPLPDGESGHRADADQIRLRADENS